MAYHHGNARAALLAAAAELLESEGAARLSLRQAAERAGLSRQAPYNHFADKETLLAELVREGYEQLGGRIRADARLAIAPLERLARAAETYIAFGQERSALFRLMFSKDLVDLSKYGSAQQAASAALAELSAIIEAMAPPTDPHDVTLVAWSLVHGYTSLCIESGVEAGDQRRRRAGLFARTVEALTQVKATRLASSADAASSSKRAFATR